MSAFAAVFAIGAEAQDAIYDEPIRLLPQIGDSSSEYVAVGTDADRPSRDINGIFDDDTFISRVLGSGANTHENTDVLTGKSQVDFAAALFATDTDLPHQGDEIVLTGRTGQPKYQIISVEPDGISRVICLLTALGATS